MKLKQYLGDSVYVYYDGYHVVLTTDNGEGPTNTIYCEPSVLDALIRYNEDLKEAIGKLAKA